MKEPKNFEKLHELKFSSPKGNPFFFEIGIGKNHNSLWIYDAHKNGDGIQKEYCSLMTFNWGDNSFDLKKCILGQGDNGKDIHKNLTLPIEKCKSKDEFVSFVSELIENEAMKGTYNTINN